MYRAVAGLNPRRCGCDAGVRHKRLACLERRNFRRTRALLFHAYEQRAGCRHRYAPGQSVPTVRLLRGPRAERFHQVDPRDVRAGTS